MLKRDGTQAHEALASLEASQPKAGEHPYLDYHHEAREYEKKLIQVINNVHHENFRQGNYLLVLYNK
jgi:hypothetical protein